MESPFVASCDRLETRRVLDKMLLIVEVSAMVGNNCGVNVTKSDRVGEAKPQMKRSTGGRMTVRLLWFWVSRQKTGGPGCLGMADESKNEGVSTVIYTRASTRKT